MMDASLTRKQLPFQVPQLHKCFDDHFPGNPVVPGALLLKWIFGCLQQELSWRVVKVKQIKFLSVVRPGDLLDMAMDVNPATCQVLLTVRVNCLLVLQGTIEIGNV